MSFRIFVLVLALALVGIAGWAVVTVYGSNEEQRALESFRQELAQAHEVAGSSKHTLQEYRQANATLVRGIADPRFRQFTDVERGDIFAGAGWAALRLDDSARARDLFSEATRLDPETSQPWIKLAYIESDLRHYDAAARALAEYLKRQPEQTQDSEQLILYLAHKAEPGSPGLLALLQLLFEREWASDDPRASQPWRRLALERIRRGEMAAARAAIARVTHADSIVRLHIDKRFDGLFDPKAPQFDPVAAARRRVDELKAKVALEPTNLKLLLQSTRAMLAMGMHEAVLEATDGVPEAPTGKSGKALPQDPDEIAWVLNNRATALRNLNRIDEAQAVTEAAAALGVDGQPNVGMTLNLAWEHCVRGRGKDALAAAARVRDLSAYGRMVQVYVQHCASLLERDEQAAAKALDYLRTHHADSEGLFLSALIRANRLDEAARTIVGRLEAEATRSDMLYEMQDFLESDTAPKDLQRKGRWESLMARGDVRAALEKVGRVERFDYYGAAW